MGVCDWTAEIRRGIGNFDATEVCLEKNLGWKLDKKNMLVYVHIYKQAHTHIYAQPVNWGCKIYWVHFYIVGKIPSL